MGLRKGNLYEIYFTKLNEANVSNLIELPKKHGTFELRHSQLQHLNVRDVMHFKA